MINDIEQFWNILAEMQVCMVTTVDGDVIRSRPMAPYVDAKSKTIHFMTDSDSAKILEIDQDRSIALAFSNPEKMIFASVSGKGVISYDRTLIKEMWGPYADVFFGGTPDDAAVAIIKVIPSQAEFWDNRKNKVAMAIELTRAYFTDDGPDLGENAKLDLAG